MCTCVHFTGNNYGSIPEILNMVLKLFQLLKVPDGIGIKEGLCAGAPVDVCSKDNMKNTKHFTELHVKY